MEKENWKFSIILSYMEIPEFKFSLSFPPINTVTHRPRWGYYNYLRELSMARRCRLSRPPPCSASCLPISVCRAKVGSAAPPFKQQWDKLSKTKSTPSWRPQRITSRSQPHLHTDIHGQEHFSLATMIGCCSQARDNALCLSYMACSMVCMKILHA